MSSNDKQVGGTHYKDKKLQPWEVMEAWMTTEEFQAYLRGNVIKYIARYKDKNGVQDLEKCKHYLEKLMEVMAKVEGAAEYKELKKAADEVFLRYGLLYKENTKNG